MELVTEEEAKKRPAAPARDEPNDNPHLDRAATDLADPDPDLLTTRIQNSRSGSVNKTCLLNLVQKFGHLKSVS